MAFLAAMKALDGGSLGRGDAAAAAATIAKHAVGLAVGKLAAVASSACSVLPREADEATTAGWLGSAACAIGFVQLPLFGLGAWGQRDRSTPMNPS